MLFRSKLAIVVHADAAGRGSAGEALGPLAAAVSAYGGTLRERRGQALVAEFPRISSAVCAALAARAGDAARSEAGGDGPRIGIALGEVAVRDDGVAGAGVVLAQRLSQTAAPGTVVVHGALRGALPARLPLECRDLGERTLPGFDDPVPAFEVTLCCGAGVPAPDPGDATGDGDAAMRLYSRSSRRETYTVLAILLVVGAVSTWRMNRPAPPAQPPAAPAAAEDAPAAPATVVEMPADTGAVSARRAEPADEPEEKEEGPVVPSPESGPPARP